MDVIWSGFTELSVARQAMFLAALAIAFGFEFINGFHDTANAVTTVIYTRTLRPTPAVLFSGLCNFLGVLLGGTAVAFSIVNLLPVDLLIEADTGGALSMVLSLLAAGVAWNLSTWWLGLPVSSSHTLIGSILGVGLVHGLLTTGGLSGLNWLKVADVGLSLLLSPMVGLAAAAALLLLMKRILVDPRLYEPPVDGERPPRWIQGILLTTCAGVSAAHGSNDGQKGMGLILLVLIGFLPSSYALDLNHPGKAAEVRVAAISLRESDVLERIPTDLHPDLDFLATALAGKSTFAELPSDQRWAIRQAIFRLRRALPSVESDQASRPVLTASRATFSHAIEFVPLWVVVGVALALGIGTTIGYERIVVTVAEKIGKSHLTYAQGAVAEAVAAATILLADRLHLPVSTTQVLSSGVAGTMWANGSGVQGNTVRKIATAWLLTLPASMLLSATLYLICVLVMGDATSPTASAQ